MTLKNSFLTSLYENFKRRTWLFALSALFFFLYFPVAVLLSNKANMTYITTAQDMAQQLETIESNMTVHLGFNGVTVFVLIVFAVLCAIQGYSYLDSRQKVDFYHSLPVSKAKRFFTIFINGVLAVAVPYLVCLALGLLAAGLTSWSIAAGLIPYAFLSYLLNMLFYMAVYSMSILGVMLTGNKVLAFLGIGFLSFYELFFRLLVSVYSSTFFHSFSNNDVDSFFSKTFTSPIILYIMKMGEADTHPASLATKAPAIMAGAILPLLAFLLVFAGVSYLLYLKRPSESAGKAVAFPRLKPVLKQLIIVPSSAFLGLFIYSITYSIPFLLLGFLVSLLLCHGIVEIIFEFDLRACLRHGRHIIIGAALTLLFYLVFQFDLIGFDRYVPDPSDVESVAFITSSFSQSYYNIDGDRIGYSGWYDYPYRHSNVEDVETVCGLVKASYGNLKYSSRNYWDEWPENVTPVSLCYNMKNGRRIYRTIYVDFKESEEQLNAIFTTQGYKQGVYQIFDTDIFNTEFYSASQISYSNGVSKLRIPYDKTAELMDIYRKDLLNLTFTEQSSGLACGEINVYRDYTENHYSSNVEWNFPIFPSFENTLAFLKENGLFIENYVSADEVYCATVTDYTEVSDDDGYDEYNYDDYDYSDYAVTAEGFNSTDYTDKRQLAEILRAVYPESLTWHSLFDAERIDKDYVVTLNNPSDSEIYDSYESTKIESSYLGNKTFYLIRDRIPGFLGSN